MSVHNRDDRLEFRRERTMVDTYQRGLHCPLSPASLRPREHGRGRRRALATLQLPTGGEHPYESKSRKCTHHQRFTTQPVEREDAHIMTAVYHLLHHAGLARGRVDPGPVVCGHGLHALLPHQRQPPDVCADLRGTACLRLFMALHIIRWIGILRRLRQIRV